MRFMKTFRHVLHNFKTKQPIPTCLNPQEPALKVLQNGTTIEHPIEYANYSMCILNAIIVSINYSRFCLQM